MKLKDLRETIVDIFNEAKKRDYKAEYKKYGSSTKAKKYRAELNKYNRQKGTYGNGDKLDASHRNGKIVGFEEQSKNRGRAEKSRLKKEGKFSAGKHTFDTGASFRGNGMSIYDRNQEQGGDYKNIAHIAPSGKITIYDPKVKKSSKLMKALNDISKQFMKEGKLKEGHTISFSKEEMAKLHKDGSIEKGGHTYLYNEGKLTELSKKHFMDMVEKEIESVKGQMVYSRDKIRDNDLEDWEKKEYSTVWKDAQQRLRGLVKRYKNLKKLPEGKLTEASDGKWVVWVGQGSRKNRKLVKVGKSRRAALVFYNKLINSDKYDELGMESAEHWNRTNSPKVQEGNLSEISGKKVKFNSRDWKKLNKLASKKKVMVKSGFGDYFTWDKADRDTVWVTDRYGKEYQLQHSEIDELRIQG
tara:strand:- start:745 stop:1983 length:1239 start_codon:yes stop_codon:yes gene_type:complete